MTRSRALGGTLAGTLAIAVATTAAAAAEPGPEDSTVNPDPTGAGCSLAGATLEASADPDTTLGETFTDYADSGVGWTGADSTYSVPLHDGTIAWIFSDTFLGPVSEDGSRPESTPFLNNSIVLQDGDNLTTITGGSAAEPESLVGKEPDGSWHWFGAGTTTRTGDLQVGVLQFTPFGSGQFDWSWTENGLATIDTDSWQVTAVDPLPSGAGIQWASWYQRLGGHTYVYGVEDLGDTKYMHVARVLGGDLTDQQRWRYWDGAGWTKHEAASARVMPGVANEYSVTPYRDGYLLITQDTTTSFSGEIKAYLACSPTGPFVGGTTIYEMPEVGADGSYGNPNVITYNAHEHPELRDDDSLRVTYNVNSLDSSELYDDVTIYRPRFVEISLDVRS